MAKNNLSLPADLYTREYFLADCGGYRNYLESGGMILDDRLRLSWQLGRVEAGMRVLDLGCGRGELVLHSALKGALVKGVDYSSAALALAKKIIPSRLKDKAVFEVKDLKRLSEPDDFYDVIFLTDVVEHLYQWELEVLFGILYRILKPEGRVVIHTSPNRLLYDFTLPLFNFWSGSRKVLQEIRTPYEKLMHVNEQSVFGLRFLLRKKSFFPVWAYADFSLIANDGWLAGWMGRRLFAPWLAKSLLFVAAKSASVATKVRREMHEMRIANDLIFSGQVYALEDGGRWSGKQAAIYFWNGMRETVDLRLDFSRPQDCFPDVLRIKNGCYSGSWKILLPGERNFSVPVKKNAFNLVRLRMGKDFLPAGDKRRLSFKFVSGY